MTWRDLQRPLAYKGVAFTIAHNAFPTIVTLADLDEGVREIFVTGSTANTAQGTALLFLANAGVGEEQQRSSVYPRSTLLPNAVSPMDPILCRFDVDVVRAAGGLALFWASNPAGSNLLTQVEYRR